MKILPKHFALGQFALWMICLGFILVLFFPYAMIACFPIHALFWLLAIILFFTPFANRKASAPIKRLPFWQALSITWAAQIMLVLLFYTLCHVTAVAWPILVLQTPTPLPLFEISMKALLLKWMAFPWGVFALVAATLAYRTYIQKQVGDMSSLMRPLLRNAPQDPTSISLDVPIKVTIAFTLAISLAALCLECIGLIGQHFSLTLAGGFRLDVLLLAVLMLRWSRGKSLNDLVKKSARYHLSTPIMMALSLLLITVVFLALSSFAGWFSPHWLLPSFSAQSNFSPAGWVAMWGVFMGVWWLCWTPLMAGLFAYVWRGYRIRTLLFFSLFLPLLAQFYTAAHPHWEISLSRQNSWWNLLPVVLGAILLLALFLRARSITYAWKATLPVDEYSYRRSPQSFLYRLFQGIILVICLYWIGGTYLLTIPYVAINYVSVVLVLVVGLLGRGGAAHN